MLKDRDSQVSLKYDGVGIFNVENLGQVERSGQMDLESSIRKFQEMNKQLTLGTDVTEETNLNSTSSLTSIDQKLK